MKKTKTIIKVTGVFILLFSYGIISGNIYHPGISPSDQTTTKSDQTATKSTQTTTKSDQTTTKSTQTTTKSTQTKPKTTQTTTKSTQTKPKTTQSASKSTQAKPKTTQPASKSEPEKKSKDSGIVKIGSQNWAVANLNVSTFRNGDTIPEARTNKEWEEAGKAGKPAWCYYNNDPANGLKYGKLYNWYAVNDPRELAPEGWTLSSDNDWQILASNFQGPQIAGTNMKSSGGWSEGYNGTNESGFTALPGGYRIENGSFLNIGTIGSWWSTTESKSATAIDHYLAMSGISRSSNPKQRGESVRCLKK